MSALASARCPLTVVGGFLGAGKTTLVNRLLASATGRYVVLVNDFGAINVDADLIAEHSGTTLRLTNGCVCCSLADDFLGTLISILDEGVPFDHMIIEASGVGDPWIIAEIALVEPQLVLSAVIVLADADRLPVLLADARLADTVTRQIRAADVVLLNKLDLVDEAGVRRNAETLRALKPGVRIVPCVAAAVPEDLLGLSAAFQAPSRFRATPGHEDSFHRVLYRREGCFDQGRLADVLGGLPPSVLRLKGFCRIVGAAQPMVLQMVGSRWSLVPFAGAPERQSAIELVAIGTKDLGAAAPLETLLDAALAGAGPADGRIPARPVARPTTIG